MTDPETHGDELELGVDRLFAGPLEEFVAARDALAKRVAVGGDKVGSQRVKRLSKPTVAAWVVNQVVRERPKDVEALTSIGDELRAATADRDRGRIKALDRLRRERTQALVATVRDAGEVGGRPVSDAVLDRLSETLTAAVMDEDAAVVVRAGRLSHALQHVGFGLLDEGGEPADVVALRAVTGAEEPEAPEAQDEDEDESRPEVEPEREPEPESEEPHGAALEDAERAVEETSAELDRLEARRDETATRLREAEDAVGRLEAELARAEAERDAAQDELDALDADLQEAEDRAAEARRRRREARRAR